MLEIADFAGRWSVARRIADSLAGQAGRFDGAATLTAAGPGVLAFDESGLLQLGSGPALAARRGYRWTFNADGVAVAFADGRAFHRFTPWGCAPGTDHPCGADLYRVTYDFRAWPDWRTVWQVTGPRKDYRMETLFRRVPD